MDTPKSVALQIFCFNSRPPTLQPSNSHLIQERPFSSGAPQGSSARWRWSSAQRSPNAGLLGGRAGRGQTRRVARFKVFRVEAESAEENAVARCSELGRQWKKQEKRGQDHPLRSSIVASHIITSCIPKHPTDVSNVRQ